MLKFELDIDVKRCYFKGELSAICPKCESKVDSHDHFMYPKKGDAVDFWCQECDHEWTPYKIKSMTIEVENYE